MGYDLHITRADDWAQNDDAPIAEDEWLMLASGDPDLFPMPENGQSFFTVGSPDDADIWFDWFQGNVYTKNPDRSALEKMLELASRLGARVQGDDGEWYGSPDDLG